MTKVKLMLPCLSNALSGSELPMEKDDRIVVSESSTGAAILNAYDSVFCPGRLTSITLSAADARTLAATLLELAADREAVENVEDEKQPERRLANLTAQAQKVYQHMRRAGSISAREAMNDYGITSASLARRICDIEVEGFEINRSRRVHPITGLRYTRYSLSDYTPSN